MCGLNTNNLGDRQDKLMRIVVETLRERIGGDRLGRIFLVSVVY